MAMQLFLIRCAGAWLALSTSSASFALGGGGEALPPVGSAGGPSRTLRWREAERWLAGRELFRREHADTDGLGAPGFNAVSCAVCHEQPALGGAGGPQVDVLTPRGASHYVPGKRPGNQLVRLHELREQLREKGLAAAELFDVRQTPSLLGLGLVDTIPDEEILRNEDPGDEDGDGVRGVASRVEVNGATEIGRFGWKSEVPRLADFVCRALGGELGLTAPDQGRGFGLFEDPDFVADPETSQEALDDLDFFVAHLAAPRRVGTSDPRLVRSGEVLFERIGCTACHVPVLYGSEGPVQLYSDLLLHALETPTEDAEAPPELVPFGKRALHEREPATGTPASLFRTAPLWGVGGTAPYLHDGSASTLAEAVLAHGAEGAWARDRYASLTEADQQALLAFLYDL